MTCCVILAESQASLNLRLFFLKKKKDEGVFSWIFPRAVHNSECLLAPLMRRGLGERSQFAFQGLTGVVC